MTSPREKIRRQNNAEIDKLATKTFGHAAFRKSTGIKMSELAKITKKHPNTIRRNAMELLIGLEV